MAAPMNVNIEKQKIRQFAILSRIVIFGLQLLFNTIIPDHDAGIFDPPELKNKTFIDKMVDSHLQGLVRWDGVYYTHIAQYGYTYENCLAFFPLFPFIVRITSAILYIPFGNFICFRSCIFIACFLLNQWLFIQTSECIYYLGTIVLRSKIIAYRAALLFCVNPASIFMSAAYTETLFLYLTLKGLIYHHRGSPYKAAASFGLSGLTRSNGVLNLGFILHAYFKSMVCQVSRLTQTVRSKDYNLIFFFLVALCFNLVTVITTVLLCVGPFILFQVYSYQLFCLHTVSDLPGQLIDYGARQGYIVKGHNQSSWCNQNLPVAYSYIQKHHWNLGMFNYYEFKQIPNFLLATPVTVLAVKSLWHYYRNNTYTCCTLGLRPWQRNTSSSADDFCNWKLLTYMIHLMVLLVFGWLNMHIQVVTRLLFSCSPILYWYAARFITIETKTKVNEYDVMNHTTLGNIEDYDIYTYRNFLIDKLINIQTQSLTTKCILGYFVTYFVVGTILFSNNLPWT